MIGNNQLSQTDQGFKAVSQPKKFWAFEGHEPCAAGDEGRIGFWGSINIKNIRRTHWFLIGIFAKSFHLDSRFVHLSNLIHDFVFT